MTSVTTVQTTDLYSPQTYFMEEIPHSSGNATYYLSNSTEASCKKNAWYAFQQYSDLQYTTYYQLSGIQKKKFSTTKLRSQL